MDHTPKRIPSPLLSLVPILVLVTLLFVTIHTFGSDALSGGSQVVLLTATAVCCLIAMGYSKVRWKAIELAMVNNISGVATALIILLIIGALSGSWMISGVVPTLIYYGMQIIHPSFFLASVAVASCAKPATVKIVSVMIMDGTVVIIIYLICLNKGVSVTEEARTVVSESGDILSPK